MKSHPYLMIYWQLMGAKEGRVSFLKGFGISEATHVLVEGPAPCSYRWTQWVKRGIGVGKEKREKGGELEGSERGRIICT